MKKEENKNNISIHGKINMDLYMDILDIAEKDGTNVAIVLRNALKEYANRRLDRGMKEPLTSDSRMNEGGMV